MTFGWDASPMDYRDDELDIHASLATTNFYARYVKAAQIRAMQENAL